MPVEGRVVGETGLIKHYINYYQWVPVVLLAQALLFRLPCLFWRLFSDRSGININNLVEAAETIQNALYPERREKTIRYMIRHLDHYLDYQREYRGGGCDFCQQCLARSRSRLFRRLVCGNRRGNYLVWLYGITKLLYLLNVIGQFYLLDVVLGGGYHLYGFRVVANAVTGDWYPFGIDKRSIFPLVTLCDFNIRQMGNVHVNTIQCVLPINFFSEKIFLVLWFWLAILGAITAISICRWVWVLVPERGRRRYVRQNLKIMGRLKSSSDISTSSSIGRNAMESDRERKLSRRFAEFYLRQDGVFVLKLVAKNSTDLVVADIIAALWDNFRGKPSGMSGGGGAIDRCPPGVSSSGDGSNIIGGGRAGRRGSPGIAYIGDINDLGLDPIDMT